MSGVGGVPLEKYSNRQAPLPVKTGSMNKEKVVLLNGPPLRTTYLANCRLCLSSKFGEHSTSIVDKQFKIMLDHVFRFPITFQKGMPMSVCTKCCKGVELFYRYTYQVLANQKILDDSLISDKKSEKSSINRTVHARAQHAIDSNRGKRTSKAVEIANYDEIDKEKDDNWIDVDMQCEPALEDDEFSRHSFSQPSSYEATQTHFVAVAGPPDIFLGMETDGFECTKQRNTKTHVEDAPFVIEIISASDDEYEVSAENENVTKQNYSRTKHAIQNRNPMLKELSNKRTSPHAKLVAAHVKNVTKAEKPKQKFFRGVTLVDIAKLSKKATDAGISSKNIDKGVVNALSPRSNARDTMKQKNATKPAERFPRRSFN